MNGALPAPDGALLPADCELVPVADLAEALARAAAEPDTAVLAGPDALARLAGTGGTNWAEQILTRLYSGVAVLDGELRVTWANPALRAWCDGDPVGRPLVEALGGPEVRGPDPDPFRTALSGQTASARLVRQSPCRHLDVHITPCPDCSDSPRLVVMCRDATGEVVRQQKLDALYLAGGELGGLAAEVLAEMDVDARVELLKQNLRRAVHDLLQYDVIEIRLLNPRTGELVPLLEEGMTPEAAGRRLYARAEGNGVTGHVAATGEPYLCRDTASDPLYLPGAAGARSSLTVPLIAQGEVIGTLNVENPNPGAFNEEDLRFAELFASQVAQALHTLELLSAQQSCTAARSIDAVNREIALPADEVLTAVSALMARSTGA
ncbi:MAG TPA: GAF domain-containing protein, partial [Gemmataceae bacterium]